MERERRMRERRSRRRRIRGKNPQKPGFKKGKKAWEEVSKKRFFA